MVRMAPVPKREAHSMAAMGVTGRARIGARHPSPPRRKTSFGDINGAAAETLQTAQFPRPGARRRSPSASDRSITGRARRELAIFGAVYGLYDAARWVFVGRLPAARAHARSVIHLERSLHVAIEGSVQRDLNWGVASFLLANIYLAAQLVVLPGALIWIYHHSPAVYRQLRNTVVMSWLIAVPVFALFPVAPPRLAGIGIKDTVSHQAGVALTGHSTIFYNPYAAVPSLHVGLAFAIGIALAATIRTRWLRALALGWGPLVTLAVIATGNHYVFDVVTGMFVTSVAFASARIRDHLTVRGSPARRPARFRLQSVSSSTRVPPAGLRWPHIRSVLLQPYRRPPVDAGGRPTLRALSWRGGRSPGSPSASTKRGSAAGDGRLIPARAARNRARRGADALASRPGDPPPVVTPQRGDWRRRGT